VREYDLEIPLLLRLFPIVMLAFFIVGVPVILVISGPTFLLVPWLGIVGLQWWGIATLAYRVILHDDGLVEWVALGRRVKTLPEDIREIRPEKSGSIGFFVVKHASGKVRFLNQITGFHEVLAHVKSRNPTVVLKGC